MEFGTVIRVGQRVVDGIHDRDKNRQILLALERNLLSDNTIDTPLFKTVTDLKYHSAG